MTLHQVLVLAAGHPWLAAGLTAALLVVAVGTVWALVSAARHLDLPPGSVVAAGLGAAVCTAYSGDTSWRFAEHHLGMTDSTERAVMFAAGELALFACAVMARANKAATTTEETAGTAGVPGALVWCITGIQIVPAFSESGVWGGLVRAAFGPVGAGLLWHLAMGLEVRVGRPGALSTGLPALIGRELRERLLSRLGLAVRDRTAEQISRDRATARAVRLAALLELRPTGWRASSRRRRLAAAVADSGAATNGEQRHRLLQQLAARRTSGQLATVPLHSPWAGTPVPEDPYPSTPLGVTGAQLRRMDPLAAVHQVRSAHPDATPAELAALLVEYGVPVSETQVRIAVGAGNPPPAVAADVLPLVLTAPPAAARLLPVICRPQPTAPAAPAQPTAPALPPNVVPVGTRLLPVVCRPPALGSTGLHLDLAPMLPALHAVTADAHETPQLQPHATPPAALRPGDEELITRALALAATGPLSGRRLERELHIGQRRSQRILAAAVGRLRAAEDIPLDKIQS
ncbi:hypothetical protein [Streptomyces sp. NPDC008125]|uniref:hypothetical protein n=1 Tax=Streptomyces sp. NPDC008125 TaxID=3364811 RepID=UPI0036F02217